MIKNWTTTFKTIKNGVDGVKNYIKYLQNENHRNHKGKDHNIIEFGINKNKVIVENQKILDQFNYKKLLENKGGRPAKSFGVSVVISLPFNIATNQLQKYKDELIKKYYIDMCKMENLEYNEKSFKKYKSLIFVNTHTKETGSKTQLNLTIPHYLPFKEITKQKRWFSDEESKTDVKKLDMTQRRYSYLLKEVNNNIVRSVLKKDNRTYEPERKKVGKRKSIVDSKISEKEQQLLDKQKELEHKEMLVKAKELEKKELENNMSNNRDFLILQIEEFKKKQQQFEDEKIDDKTLKKYMLRIENYIKENNIEKVKETFKKIEVREKKVKNYNNSNYDRNR